MPESPEFNSGEWLKVAQLAWLEERDRPNKPQRNLIITRSSMANLEALLQTRMQEKRPLSRFMERLTPMLLINLCSAGSVPCSA
jgi:uncharacterized protein YecT (DUF1311 family)